MRNEKFLNIYKLYCNFITKQVSYILNLKFSYMKFHIKLSETLLLKAMDKSYKAWAKKAPQTEVPKQSIGLLSKKTQKLKSVRVEEFRKEQSR